MKQITIINGPNLNLLGLRNPELYGNQTFETFFLDLKSSFKKSVELQYYQSNHEGKLIDKLHEIGFEIDGIVLNAGAYTHTSIAIRDAIEAITVPVIEVHITDIFKREPFRQRSYLTSVCKNSIVGQGMDGYRQAVNLLIQEP